MRGRSFGVLSWVLSLLGCLLVARLAGSPPVSASDAADYIVWSGSFFFAVFLGGFAGLRLSLALNRRGRPLRRRGWLAAFILSGVLLFGAGAGGQALFMLSREEITRSSAVDLALLLDASGSMDSAGYNAPRTEAAVQFVDAMDEDIRIQAVSFASTVLDHTELLTMDDSGKAAVIDFIRAIDSVGMTDFDSPVSLAIDTLAAQSAEDHHQAIILLTDGEGTLSTDTATALMESGIRLFSIRIDAANSSSQEARTLIDLAEATGGFDTRLEPSTDGGVDTATLLDAFEEAFQASSETRIQMEETLLLSSVNTSPYQFLVRLVTLVLCAVLFGIGYFARWSFSAAACNALSGGVLTVLTTLMGSPGVSILLTCILLGAAYVVVRWEGGDPLDV